MRVFVDTSAILAVLIKEDENHQLAQTVWKQLITNRTKLVTTSYVLLETIALLQRRFGLPIVHIFQKRIRPMLNIEWVEGQLHEAGIQSVLTLNRRQVSLVDCTSFIVCRNLQIEMVFAYDNHFLEQGFRRPRL